LNTKYYDDQQTGTGRPRQKNCGLAALFGTAMGCAPLRRCEGGDPRREHIIEVQVGRPGLDPKSVRVELYAGGIKERPPVRQEMACLHPLADESGGYVYNATVPASRPPADYTARILPYYDGVAIPLEDARIPWQR
jgi:starch phosphorylase